MTAFINAFLSSHAKSHKYLRLGMYLLPFGIFSIFMVFLVWQHLMVFPYHDDYGFAVLGYQNEQTGFTGTRFPPSKLFAFLRELYLQWTGRIVPFFLEISLFRLGINWVRLFQVMNITAIIVIANAICMQRCRSTGIMLVSIIYFLSIPVYTAAGGLYWFSAASAYVWGIPFLLGAACMVARTQQFRLPSATLVALSALFHEQMAMAACTFMLFWPILSNSTNQTKLDKVRHMVNLFMVFTASAFTILAPGNFRRAAVSSYPTTSKLELIKHNFDIIEFLSRTSESNSLKLLLAFSFVLLCIKWYAISKNRRFAILTFIVCMVIFIALNAMWHWVALILISLYAGALLIRLRFIGQAGLVALLLYLSAIASLLPQLLSPGASGRGLLTCYFLLIVPVMYSFSIWQKRTTHFILLMTIFLITVLPPALRNASVIFNGYRENYSTNLANHYKLSAASYEYARGGSYPRSIVLYKLPRLQFAERMPYEENVDVKYIERWMKKYYSLPNIVTFNWASANVPGQEKIPNH